MPHFQMRSQFVKPTDGGLGHCGVCRMPRAEDGVLDLGVNFDPWHEMDIPMQLCKPCAVNIGRQFGMLTPEESTRLKAQLMQAEAARAHAEMNWKKADRALRAVRDYEDA